MSSMDIPHKLTSPESDAPRPDCISDEDVGASCRQNFKDGDEYVGPPIHSKPHIFNPEREDCKIHVRGIDSLWDSKNETNERANIQKNKLASEMRVKMMPTLFSSVPTNKEFENCSQPWGNCSESVPWRALHGQRKPRRCRVVLYTQTINLKKNMKTHPCIMCQLVMDSMNHHAIIRLL